MASPSTHGITGAAASTFAPDALTGSEASPFAPVTWTDSEEVWTDPRGSARELDHLATVIRDFLTGTGPPLTSEFMHAFVATLFEGRGMHTYTDRPSFVQTLPAARMKFLLQVLDALRSVCMIETHLPVFTETGTEEMQRVTLGKILNEITKEHGHEKVIGDTLYTCDFHQESLIVHMLSAMMIAFLWETQTCFDDEEFATGAFRKTFISCFIALFHDIGKPCTTQTTHSARNWLAYPCHGEMGGSLLQQLLISGAYSEWFTTQDIETITHTVCIHMCGYHVSDPKSPEAEHKWPLLATAPESCKRYLTTLSVADHFGAIGKTSDLENDRKFMMSRGPLDRSLNCPDNTLAKFIPKNGLNGIMVVLHGHSASGKSTLAQSLAERYGGVVCSRDESMMIVVSAIMASQSGSAATPVSYRAAYEFYSRNRKLKAYGASGDKSPSELVNEHMRNKIAKGLSDGKIVIVDSLIMMYEGARAVIPDIANNALVIGITVARTAPITEADGERLGMTVEEQINLIAKGARRGILDAFHSMDGMSLGAMKSRSSNRFPSSTPCPNWQPHLCFNYTWNTSTALGLAIIEECLTNAVEAMATSGSVDVNKMHAIHYINWLYNKHGATGMFESLRGSGFTVSHGMFKGSSVEQRYIIVKYRENTRNWTTWGRECRGIELWLNNFDKWIVISFKLQRGPEVLTGTQVERGLRATQDVSDATDKSELNTFSQELCDVIGILQTSSATPGWRTSSKADGSTLIVKLFPLDSAVGQAMMEAIELCGDDFAKMVRNSFLKLGVVGVIGTQGTFSVSDDMQPYMVTAIAADCGIADDAIAAYAKMRSCVQGLEDLCEPFFERIVRLYNQNPRPDSHSHTFMFEAICKDREDAWSRAQKTMSWGELTVAVAGLPVDVIDSLLSELSDDLLGELADSLIDTYQVDNWALVKLIVQHLSTGSPSKAQSCARRVHTELATSYPVSFMRFLGLSTVAGDQIQFVPHYDVNNGIFDEPYWWNIADTNQIVSMMDNLGCVIRGEMTLPEFLATHPPNNTVPVRAVYVDVEGFVLYTPSKDGGVCYSKLKTDEYYKAHKYKPQYLAFYVELAKTAMGRFPLADIVSSFFNGLDARLLASCTQLLSIMSSNEEMLVSKLQEKAQKAFPRMPAAARPKVLLNNGIDEINEHIFNAFVPQFPELRNIALPRTCTLTPVQHRQTVVVPALKAIVMKSQPWETDVMARITELIEATKTGTMKSTIGELFEFCLASGGARDEVDTVPESASAYAGAGAGTGST
jgi:hypothetical protein